MSWVVRVTHADSDTVDTLEIAATLADASGWAQDGPLMLIGFTELAAAEQFAAIHDGTVERAQSWGTEELSQVWVPTGKIELEVGTAFGHGTHPTTGLALAALNALGPGNKRTLLDVGTGTGVLSIAAARQGFVATGCDIDPDAVAIAVRNAERNSVGTNASFVIASPSQLASPQWLGSSSGFDIIVSNTLVGVHETEGPAIVLLGSPTATIIATGLHGEAQVERAVLAYPGYHLVGQSEAGPWSLIVLRR